MVMFQAYNRKSKSHVKYNLENNRSEIVDVKQKNPSRPFKGVKIRGKRK